MSPGCGVVRGAPGAGAGAVLPSTARGWGWGLGVGLGFAFSVRVRARSARTVVVADGVDDPRAEVVHVEHDALGHRAVVRARRAVEPALMAEAIARRELRVTRDAVVPRLRHCARVGQDTVEVRREEQEEQHVEDRLVRTGRGRGRPRDAGW